MRVLWLCDAQALGGRGMARAIAAFSLLAASGAVAAAAGAHLGVIRFPSCLLWCRVGWKA